MDFVGNKVDQPAKEVTGDLACRALVELSEGKLGRPVNRHKHIELAFFGSNLGDVDVEIANRIGLELFLG